MCAPDTKWDDEKLRKALEKKLNFQSMSMATGPAVYHSLHVAEIRKPIGLATISTEGEGEDGVVRASHLGSDHVFLWDESTGELTWIIYCDGHLRHKRLKENRLEIEPWVGGAYVLDLSTGEKI